MIGENSGVFRGIIDDEIIFGTSYQRIIQMIDCPPVPENQREDLKEYALKRMLLHIAKETSRAMANGRHFTSVVNEELVLRGVIPPGKILSEDRGHFINDIGSLVAQM